MSGSILRAENLHLWRAERHVLKGVDLTVRGGELLQLTGANGAGKTTLLRALCGLNHLEEGRVFWNEQDVREDRDGFHAALVYLGHEPPLKPDLSGVENLQVLDRHAPPLDPAAIDEALMQNRRRRIRDAPGAHPVGRAAAARGTGRAGAGAPCRCGCWMSRRPIWTARGQELVATLLDAHLAAGGLAIAAVHHRLAIEPARLRELNLSA